MPKPDPTLPIIIFRLLYSCWLVDQQIPFATTRFTYPHPPNRIHALLETYELQDMPSLEELARQSHMTSRSIGHKLHEEGTSLRNIRHHCGESMR